MAGMLMSFTFSLPVLAWKQDTLLLKKREGCVLGETFECNRGLGGVVARLIGSGLFLGDLPRNLSCPFAFEGAAVQLSSD